MSDHSEFINLIRAVLQLGPLPCVNNKELEKETFVSYAEPPEFYGNSQLVHIPSSYYSGNAASVRLRRDQLARTRKKPL